MSYLRLDETLPDPYTEPNRVQGIEDATAFDTREQAEAASVRVAGAVDVVYDDQQESWYVVTV